MEAVIAPSAMQPEGFLACVTTLCVASSIIIAVRIWSNYNHSGRVFADDYMSVVALIFLILNSATVYALVLMINWDPEKVTIERLTKMCILGIFAANLSIYSAKIPLLLLYVRTFGIKKWMRWSSYSLMVVSFMACFSLATYVGVRCSPDIYPIAPPLVMSCLTAITNGSIARGSVSLALDVVMFLQPFPVLKSLNMPFRRKIGLGFVFMAGLLAIIASALGLYYGAEQSVGSSTNFVNSLLLTVIEACVVLLVSCTPALHLFWTKAAGPLRNRLGLTRLSGTASKSGRGDTARNVSRNQEIKTFGSSNGSTRPMNSHQYVELEDVPGSGSNESLAKNRPPPTGHRKQDMV